MIHYTYWIFSFRLCNVEQGFIVLEEAWLSSSSTNFNDFYKWLWSNLVQIVQFSKSGACLNFEENFQDSNYEWVTYYVSCSTETIWLRYFGESFPYLSGLAWTVYFSHVDLKEGCLCHVCPCSDEDMLKGTFHQVYIFKSNWPDIFW